MKKLFLLIVIATMSICALNAQSIVKYHGEVDFGYSLGVGTFSAGRGNIIQTIHGVQVGKYFSTGIGLGLDYYHDDPGELVMPIFLNLKGYLPVSERASIYISEDIGVGVGLTRDIKGISGLTLTPAIGIKIYEFKIQLGYNMQQFTGSGISVNMNAIQIKLGIMF